MPFWLFVLALVPQDPNAAPPKTLPKIGVVLFDFENVPHRVQATQEAIQQVFFSTHSYTGQNGFGPQGLGSVRDFFLENSCGKFDLAGKVFGWVTLDRSWEEAAYGSPDVLEEALRHVAARDGAKVLSEVDHLIFIHAGRPFLSRTSTAWFSEKTLPINVFSLEVLRVEAVVHELGHVLGLQDRIAGPWCQMSRRAHDDDFGPASFHFCVCCKESLGWIRPQKAAGACVLRPIERHAEALRVPVGSDDTEYYLLENRSRTGFDRAFATSGLLVWRVRGKAHELVEAHGGRVNAAGDIDQAAAFPVLLPAPRREGPALGRVRLDSQGVVTFMLGSEEEEKREVEYEGKIYRTLPRPESNGHRPFHIAVIPIDFEDAPARSSEVGRFQDFYLGHAPRLSIRDPKGALLGTLTASLSDYVAVASQGRAALSGQVAEWKRMPEPRANYLKQKPGAFADVVPPEADFGMIVFSGDPRPGTALSRHTGKKYLAIEEGACTADLAPSVQAIFSTLGLPMGGERVWCLSGRTVPQKGQYVPGPALPCAWCREKLGWIEPAIVRESGAYALGPATVFGGQCVKLPVSETEYYLIENRPRWEFDRALPREGLIVWHVTPPESACKSCGDNGALDIWPVHQPVKDSRARDYMPFVVLGKGLSVRLGGEKFEISGIKPDDRGNLYFEIEAR